MSTAVAPIPFYSRLQANRGMIFPLAFITLLLVILGVVRSGKAHTAPFAVGGYIAAAYWFTSSTSFANPAVTIARTLSDTFAGIRPADAPMFILAQFVGALVGLGIAKLLFIRPGHAMQPTTEATP